MDQILCERCGNPIDYDVVECPFCEKRISVRFAANRQPKRLHTVNIKRDMPSVVEAEDIFLQEINTLILQGIKVVKIIHGYGSTGVGGRIRQRIRYLCQSLKTQGELRTWIKGEDFNKNHSSSDGLENRFPYIKFDTDYGRKNPGITLIVLR